MPYDDDQAREAARARLEARMNRRAATRGSTPGKAAFPHTPADKAHARKNAAERKQATTPRALFGDVADRLPSTVPPFVIPLAAALVLLLLVFVFVIPRCSGPAPQEQQSPATQSIETQHSQSAANAPVEAVAPDKTDAKQDELVKLIGEDEAGKLLARAKTDTKALWIAAHADRYAFDGAEVQAKILKLAADEPAAIPFVREFPAKYPSSNASKDTSLAMSADSPSQDVPATSVPHLYQWDRRWAYTVYSSAAFGLTGCGPTALAMVYQGVTGKTDKTPADLAKLAEDSHYMLQYEGTNDAFFPDIGYSLGMDCEVTEATEEAITEALGKGKVLIVNFGEGQFSDEGHFAVATALVDGKNVVLNDPYSVERSSRTWDVETIANEATTVFAYSA